MKIFSETKELVRREKYYTCKILQNLMVIERDKLYSDLKYPSLYKYMIKELGYSNAEATVRVNAVRLMLKSKTAEKKIAQGNLSLTNAAEANKTLQNNSLNQKQMEEMVEQAETCSSRQFKDFVDREFKRERKEMVVIQEHLIHQFDRLRKKYGNQDLSTLELIQIMLEKELKDPRISNTQRRGRPLAGLETPKSGRYIPVAVKRAVYNGKCNNCGSRHGLEYDHIKKYSHGGGNQAGNIQILCRSCNGRKEIMARQTGFFA